MLFTSNKEIKTLEEKLKKAKALQKENEKKLAANIAALVIELMRQDNEFSAILIERAKRVKLKKYNQKTLQKLEEDFKKN